MNIAFFVDSYVPVASGMVVSVETLRLSLEGMGHNVYVLAPRYRDWNKNEPRICRMSAKFSRSNRLKPIKYPVYSHKREQLAKLNLNIIHCHFEHDTYGYGAKIARTFQIPLFATYYKVFPYEIKHEKGFLGRRHYHSSAKRLIDYSKECDKIIALSTTQRQIMQNFGVITPIEVLPVGIFTKDYSSVPKESLRKQYSIKENRIILYVGSIDNRGNINEILRVFKIINKTMDDIHLLIVGEEGKDINIRQLVAKQSFSDKITFAGAIPKTAINKIYGAADLLIYPKTLDPEPLVILESLAAGTPVVAQTGVGAQDFIVNNQDGLIADDNSEDFADKIMLLLKRERLRLDLSLKARLDAQNYRASKLTGDLLELYESQIG